MVASNKTFINQINEVEVSLAVERLLIAEFPQTWTPARIDLTSLPTGFVDLGAVVEDTPSFTVTRGKFQLDAGIPAVRQFEAVTALEGNFEISLHSNSWRKIQYAFGNFSAVSSASLISTVASVTDRNTFTLTDTTISDTLTVGKQITLAVAGEEDKADAVETRITSITSDLLTYFVSPTPIKTPAVADSIYTYGIVRQHVGTSQIRQHVLLGVADFIDGSQVIHHFFKVTPGEEFAEEIRPAENERIPLSFNAFGVCVSDVAGSSSDELVIAQRVFIPAGF